MSNRAEIALEDFIRSPPRQPLKLRRTGEEEAEEGGADDDLQSESSDNVQVMSETVDAEGFRMDVETQSAV